MKMKVTGGRRFAVFLRRARRAKASSVQAVEVGFFSTAKYPDGTPVAAVAAWNEFGTEVNGKPHVPERPFFRNAIAASKDDILAAMKETIDPKTMALDTKTAGRMGLAMVGAIKRSITVLRKPPNAPITIKGGWLRTKTGKWIKLKPKKSTNPLIDTGKMRMSVDQRIIP